MKLPPVSFLLKLFSFVIPLHTSYSLGPNDTADCSAHPDPHIVTFDGIKYDYQHGCDVDLIDAPDIKIQLRLVKYQFTSPTFSSIERLAIYFPLTGEKLEINSNGDHFLTSTSMAPNPIIATIGGYVFTKTTSTAETTYMIDLQPQGHYIYVVDLPPISEGGGLGILIRGHGSLFYNASGMCGKWNAPAPGLYDRAGFDMLPSLPFVNPFLPLIIDGSTFGDVWQVNPALEPNHISNMGLPLPAGLYAAFPNTCVARRRLQEEERVLQTSCEYCLGLNNLDQRANCEYDAMVTGGCWWVEQVPFYKKDDNFWYEKDTCCFHKVPAEVGFTTKETDPNDPDGFIVAPCQYDSGNLGLDCYQKKRCDSTAECFKLVQCQGAGCYIEADCFKQCVRVEEVEVGYQLSRTEGSGYFYDKCPHDDTCFERKTCTGTREECYVRKDCSVEFNDEVCYRDIPCPGPCDNAPPSAAPSTSSRSPSYLVTTSSPSASPTEFPIATQDPWKCIGCEWMQSLGKVIPSGVDTCDLSLRVQVKGRDGRCFDNDGACEDKPCKYRYQVRYSVNPQCIESCFIIVSDAYTSGSTPTAPIVTQIKKNKGVLKSKWEKVKCLCKTNTKLFELQCETSTGISSQSIQFDYTCSECDLMWLPPDEL